MYYRLILFILLFSSFSTLLNCSTKHGFSREQAIAEYNNFELSEGWDIYDAGGYRYGPSIIIDNSNVIHAWFASPGSVHGKDELHYDETATETPVPIRNNTVIAQQFEANVEFYAIAVRCPNWNSTKSSISFSIYEWNEDYENTLSHAPLKKVKYNNYQDNQILTISIESKFQPGKYLWVLNEPIGTPGVWAKNKSLPKVLAYADGKIVDHVYESFLMYERGNPVTYWDQVVYKTSTNGGFSWSEEKIVLKPTAGTRDQFSICDPGVVKIKDYYYLGYTSTEDVRMIFNHVYVARSKSPEGPWEKWDGKGWSLNPQPLVEFTGNKDAWGAGEPSMVVRNDTLFFYYTWKDIGKQEIRVAVADARSVDWPVTLQFKGVAVDQSNMDASDHADVKFRSDLNTFQLLHTASRFTKNAYLQLWESTDGIHFSKSTAIAQFAEPYLHNCGWSGNELGHHDPAKPQFVSYAYGQQWGNWKTKWHPVIYTKKK